MERRLFQFIDFFEELVAAQAMLTPTRNVCMDFSIE
jgi:hypothetical protein